MVDLFSKCALSLLDLAKVLIRMEYIFFKWFSTWFKDINYLSYIHQYVLNSLGKP